MFLGKRKKIPNMSSSCVATIRNDGEYCQEEIQTLDYVVQDVEDYESQTRPVVRQEDEVDDENVKVVSNPSVEASQSKSLIPGMSQSSFVENVPDLESEAIESEPIRKQLPPRSTRGIPKPTYEPQLSSKVKYPMSHYVSNHCLSKSNMTFVNQLFTVSIPNSVQEALSDPKWKAAMNEEMKSLQKNETWELVDRPP
ncbi:uncharacterized protein LOC116124075 isoform X1 [Pistacia vera]|uniref:uncharacterized protein LOC116124075 isoform X1 n=1 Tax=Pistacia vera TaxID=55513 RepID=UPI0012633B7A|nr:uncharacterized protein LOC116124075 isoform X1 [Pistacia vera]